MNILEIKKREIKFGECDCGCGKKTRISECNDSSRNRIAGVPFKFIYGHSRKNKEFVDRVMGEPNSGCILWMGSVNKDGYGKINVKNKQVPVHRFVWETANGKIPSGLVIDHLCRTHSCVNTKHLEIVTQKENVLRGISPVANNARKNNCPNCNGEYVWRKRNGKICARYCLSCFNKREKFLRRIKKEGGIKS